MTYNMFMHHQSLSTIDKLSTMVDLEPSIIIDDITNTSSDLFQLLVEFNLDPMSIDFTDIDPRVIGMVVCYYAGFCKDKSKCTDTAKKTNYTLMAMGLNTFVKQMKKTH